MRPGTDHDWWVTHARTRTSDQQRCTSCPACPLRPPLPGGRGGAGRGAPRAPRRPSAPRSARAQRHCPPPVAARISGRLSKGNLRWKPALQRQKRPVPDRAGTTRASARARPAWCGRCGRAGGRGNDAHGDDTPTGMPKTGRAGLAAQPFCTDLALLQYRGCQQGPARSSGGRRRRRRHGRRRSGRLHARGRAGRRGPPPWGTLRRLAAPPCLAGNRCSA